MEQEKLPFPSLKINKINQNCFRKEDTIFTINTNQLKNAYEKLKKGSLDPTMIIFKKITISDETITLSLEKKKIFRLVSIWKNEEKFLFCKLDAIKTSKKYAKEVLLNGFSINSKKYNFFCYSKSNLKEFSCLFYEDSLENMSDLMNKFGNFSKFNDISKKAARLSLLFSSADVVFNLPNEQIVKIDDITKNSVCFSDGCGFISKKLAKNVQKKLNLCYLPSVFQIRIQGCKGIVLVNSQIKKKELQLRDSMIKFDVNSDILNGLIICGYSKPSSYSCLNQQIIMLLSGLGVRKEYFLQKQKEYLQLLKNALKNLEKAIELLQLLGKNSLVEEIISGDKDYEKKIRAVIREELNRNIKGNLGKKKLRIPLEKSRILYGAVFDEISNNLKPNEVFIRITTAENKIQTLEGKVIMSKNPCYYVGDIRIMTAVDFPNAEITSPLYDCVIFSSNGKIPPGATMAGSDYDGDQYFISWDQDLIPKYEEEPYSYPESNINKLKRDKISQKDLIDYLVDYDRFIVGKINNRFVDFANVSELGVRCVECVKLGTELFSKAVDAAKTGEKIKLPEYCKNIDAKKDKVKHVWLEMLENCKEFLVKEFKIELELENNWKIDKENLISLINLYQEHNTSDYEIFKIIKNWLFSLESKEKIKENLQLFQFVDFGHFTQKQLEETKTLEIPKEIVKNNFIKSKIITENIIEREKESLKLERNFEENNEMKWRLYYFAKKNQINFSVLKNCLNKFKFVMLCLKLNEKVKLLFFINNVSLQNYVENKIKGEGLASYYVAFNKIHRIFLYNNYIVYYNDELFQIYQNQMGNTFLWLKKEGSSTEIKVSIDLTRFDKRILDKDPKINKQEIVELEVFIGLKDSFLLFPERNLFVDFEYKMDENLNLEEDLSVNKFVDENIRKYKINSEKKFFMPNFESFFDAILIDIKNNKFLQEKSEEIKEEIEQNLEIYYKSNTLYLLHENLNIKNTISQLISLKFELFSIESQKKILTIYSLNEWYKEITIILIQNINVLKEIIKEKDFLESKVFEEIWGLLEAFFEINSQRKNLDVFYSVNLKIFNIFFEIIGIIDKNCKFYAFFESAIIQSFLFVI